MLDETVGTAPVAAASAPDAGDIGAPVAGITAKPGEQGKPAGRPAGTLPEDVHPAVAEERERAKQYRAMVEEVYVLDNQGNPIGVRPDLIERVREELGSAQGPQPGYQPDPEAQVESMLDDFARESGLLPEQVRLIFRIASAVAEQKNAEASEPLLRSSVDSVKANILASGEVPSEAVPYVSKWIDEAYKINPRALLSPRGRETALRQALGDYLLTQIRRRRSGQPRVSNAPAGAPRMLRPRPGAAGAAPSSDEQSIRTKMGLTPTYTDNTPREV